MHGYHGLTGDGQIYAFQAFARLHPQLAADLYLQNTSQDQFTLFSPLYAWCIGLLGLENAARLLTLIFTVWFLAAAWSFARAVAGRDAAWLAVAFLLIIAGDYGASGVFRILDPFLTARLPAEALIITALACHVRGMKRLGLLLALGALFIHPLMALPGLLLLVCLWLPVRVSVVGAIGGVFATLAIAVVAINLPAVSHVSDRHGCSMVGRGAGTLAISIPATLVDSRLGRQRAAVHFLGIHGNRGGRRDEYANSAWRQRSWEPPVWQWRSSAVSSVRSRYWCKVKPGGGFGLPSSSALRWFPSRPCKCGAMKSAARFAHYCWCRVGHCPGSMERYVYRLLDFLVDPGTDQLSSGHSFSMGIRGAWRRHRGVDFDEMLGHRVAPDSSIGTRALGRGATTRHVRIEDPGRAARRAGLVGNQTGRTTWVPMLLSAMLIAFSILHFSRGIQATPHAGRRRGHP